MIYYRIHAWSNGRKVSKDYMSQLSASKAIWQLRNSGIRYSVQKITETEGKRVRFEPVHV